MKADDTTLPADLLRRLLRYEPETGELFWRERTPDMFSAGHRTAEGNCNNWNSIYAGTPALSAPNQKGQLGGTLLGFKVKAHRVIWAMVTGHWPQYDIDHEDGNPGNNRFRNLRDVTNAENRKNSKLQRNNSTGHAGVRQYPSGKWHARIKVDGRERGLGTFSTKERAIAARKSAEREFGFHPNHGRRRADEVLRPALGVA